MRADLIREDHVGHIVGCYNVGLAQAGYSHRRADRTIALASGTLRRVRKQRQCHLCRAAPNQHVVPLVRHMLDHISTDVFCIGSNYVWTWK